MNIYVGNLSFEVTEQDLQEAFEAFGVVTSVKIIKDKYSGQSKGFGFVEMAKKGDGESETFLSLSSGTVLMSAGDLSFLGCSVDA